MSHTTVLEVELTDEEVLKEALKRAGYVFRKGKVKLYSTEHEGIAVELPGWHFPVVFSNGKVYYDDYLAKPGSLKELERMLRRVKNEYAAVLVERYAKKIGGAVVKRQRSEEEIVLELEVPSWPK